MIHTFEELVTFGYCHLHGLWNVYDMDVAWKRSRFGLLAVGVRTWSVGTRARIGRYNEVDL